MWNFTIFKLRYSTLFRKKKLWTTMIVNNSEEHRWLEMQMNESASNKKKKKINFEIKRRIVIKIKIKKKKKHQPSKQIIYWNKKEKFSLILVLVNNKWLLLPIWSVLAFAIRQLIAYIQKLFFSPPEGLPLRNY